MEGKLKTGADWNKINELAERYVAAQGDLQRSIEAEMVNAFGHDASYFAVRRQHLKQR